MRVFPWTWSFDELWILNWFQLRFWRFSPLIFIYFEYHDFLLILNFTSNFCRRNFWLILDSTSKINELGVVFLIIFWWIHTWIDLVELEIWRKRKAQVLEWLLDLFEPSGFLNLLWYYWILHFLPFILRSNENMDMDWIICKMT